LLRESTARSVRWRTLAFQEDIDAIKGRIARAESARDAWHATGDKERYLEAYFMVEALELQLNQRLRQPRG
jgi:hypothetical protein